MTNTIIHTPDAWVLIHTTGGIVRICAGWSGGYLDGDYWRISSGVEDMQEEGDWYLFPQHSGSVYRCHKNAETLRMCNGGIFHCMQEAGSKRISPEELRLILEGLRQFQDGKVSDLDEDDLEEES